MRTRAGCRCPNATTVCSAIDTTKAVIMEETSLHALMRHQNQRRIRTRPVPAPVMMRIFHAAAMDVI